MIEIINALLPVLTLDWVISQLTNNDFLVAGLLAGIAFTARGVPSLLWGYITKACTVELTITNEDPQYGNVVHFLERHRIKLFSRTFSVTRNTDMYGDIESDTDYSLSIGYGKSWFIVNGVLGYVNRHFKETQGVNRLKEEIFVVFLTRNTKKISSIVGTGLGDNATPNRGIKIYTATDAGYWSDAGTVSPRSFDSLYLKPEVKDTLVSTIDDFIASREWYERKGVPYKLGIFIDGEPGTGKSSLVRAIATYLNRNMYVMTSQAINGGSVPQLTSSMMSNRDQLLVLEEIDTYGLANDRKTKEGEDGNNMSVLLNTLDGVLTPANFIFVATTNHPDKIDPAILRPGRFDLRIDLNALDYNTFRLMVSDLFEVEPDVVDTHLKEGYKPVAGSKVQNIFVTTRDFHKAVHSLQEC